MVCSASLLRRTIDPGTTTPDVPEEEAMTWVLAIGTSWLLLSVATGLLVGRAVALEEERRDQVSCEKGPRMAKVSPGP
jgi:hypothetical protein